MLLMLAPDASGAGWWLRHETQNEWAPGVQAAAYVAEGVPGLEALATATVWDPEVPVAVTLGGGLSVWTRPMPEDGGHDWNFCFSLRAEWTLPGLVQPFAEFKHWSNGKQMFNLDRPDNPGSNHLLLGVLINF